MPAAFWQVEEPRTQQLAGGGRVVLWGGLSSADKLGSICKASVGVQALPGEVQRHKWKQLQEETHLQRGNGRAVWCSLCSLSEPRVFPGGLGVIRSEVSPPAHPMRWFLGFQHPVLLLLSQAGDTWCIKSCHRVPRSPCPAQTSSLGAQAPSSPVQPALIPAPPSDQGQDSPRLPPSQSPLVRSK